MVDGNNKEYEQSSHPRIIDKKIEWAKQSFGQPEKPVGKQKFSLIFPESQDWPT